MIKHILSAVLILLTVFANAQEINYKLKMPKPQNHYYHVEMELVDFDSKELNVKMPIWAPGSYLAREFAKNVNLVKAFDEDGGELVVKKINKNTWNIKKGTASKISVKYEVYAFELSVRTSFLDLTHGFVSGSGVFMYVEGFKDKSGSVEVYPYKTFGVVTTALKEQPEGVSSDGVKAYVYEDYDQLVDCPIEVGNQEVFFFEASGVKHKVAMYNYGNYSIEQLQLDMAKVVDGATSVFGQNPNKEYTFIIHNVVQAQGGLEHRNSTVLSVNRWTYEGPKYVDFLKLVAHEYFHLWNVKRIRPVELGPFDYDKENYTSLLWVMEGFTSYYEKLILLRAGFYTEKQFIDKMWSSLNYVEGSTGTRVQPVAHASFDAWIKAYRPNENSRNTTMSYYSRGSLIAMMLDAKIIEHCKGRESLDNFLQKIYKKYYLAKGRGFSEQEFKKELSNFSGANLDDFYDKYIDGTEIPDYSKEFAPLGLKVDYTGKPKPSVGMSVSESGGKVVVTGIRSNSSAEDAGISVNDEIIGLNGYRINKKSLDDYFKMVKKGEVVNLLFSRDNQLYSSDITVTEYEKPSFKYAPAEGDDKNYYDFWLRKL